MKPLDFIRTESGSIGIITEVSTNGDQHTASVEFLYPFQELKAAWWYEDEFEVIDNLPDILARSMKHPFGSNSLQPFKP